MLYQNRDFPGAGPMVTAIRKFGCNFLCHLWIAGGDTVEWTRDAVVKSYADLVAAGAVLKNCYVNDGGAVMKYVKKTYGLSRGAAWLGGFINDENDPNFTANPADYAIVKLAVDGAVGTHFVVIKGNDARRDFDTARIVYNPYDGELPIKSVLAYRFWRRGE